MLFFSLFWFFSFLLFILIIYHFYWLLCLYPLNSDWCSTWFLTPVTGYSFFPNTLRLPPPPPPLPSVDTSHISNPNLSHAFLSSGFTLRISYYNISTWGAPNTLPRFYTFKIELNSCLSVFSFPLPSLTHLISLPSISSIKHFQVSYVLKTFSTDGNSLYFCNDSLWNELLLIKLILDSLYLMFPVFWTGRNIHQIVFRVRLVL